MNCFRIRSLTLCLGMILPFALSAARAEPPADAEGFRAIFDGKTLDGWDGDSRFWRVQDGCIAGQTTKENPAPRNTFLIWRGGKPADFQIKIEFRMPDAGFANSGVQIRSWEGPAKWQVSGYQPDMDSTDAYTGTCYGENFRGPLAGRGQKTVIGKDHKAKVVQQFASADELGKFIKKRGWNEYDITARGNRITEKINGHLMCEVTDEDTRARKDGIIALQIHAGQPMKVQFRNVRLKEFKEEAPAKTARRRRSCSLPAARATATPSTSTAPAVCSWPSSSTRTCPTPKRSSSKAGQAARPSWTARRASSSIATAARATW